MWFGGCWCYRECWVPLIFILCLLWKGNICETVEGFHIETSRTVTVQTSLCVHIPCTFIISNSYTLTQNAKGIWYKDDSVVASKVGFLVPDNPRGRVFLTGDVQKGDCSLSINDAKWSDAGTYRFRIEDGILRFGYIGTKPYVTVTALTEKPDISPIKSLIAGEEVALTCTAPGRCAGTRPTITWEGSINTPAVEDIVLDNPDGNRIYMSNITFTPARKDHTSLLTCKVTYSSDRPRTTSTAISLNVEYPPSLNITIAGYNRSIESRAVTVKEGDSQTMHCAVNGNPQANITWMKGDTIVTSIVSRERLQIELKNISISDAATYRCSAWNQHGNTSRAVDIRVEYPPRRPEISVHGPNGVPLQYVGTDPIVHVPEGSPVSLSCVADSDPPASLQWVKSGQIVGPASPMGQKLQLNLYASDEGIYTCQANNKHGHSNRSITIIMTYKPKAPERYNSSCLRKANLIECVCLIQSFPTASIEWKVNGKSYLSNYTDGNISIVTVQLERVGNSTLTLRRNDGDQQSIQCIGSNANGFLNLQLLEASKENQHWAIMIGVICGVALILLLILAIVLMKHIQKKKPLLMDEHTGGPTVNDSDAIYSNTEITHRTSNGAGMARETQPDDLGPIPEEASTYMNYGEELHYVTIDFSRLKPRAVPAEEEMEYSEVKLK
ncbi:sialic acid-binding Ig-like lectin 16 isoform X2 [Ascaphus truei]|uniref:sialic acid-binding Ig-like lectin 16 isoform X2 n=1 Tax=Ascaphus truei TaxID=8439 RepID=UPI003F5924D6